MSFLDGVKQATSKAVTGAQNLMGEQKLKSQIADCEKQINNTYTKLGEMYYNTTKDNPDERFAERFKTINAQLNKIKSLEAEILVLKNVVCCPSCGAECSAELAFCGNCGTKIEKKQAQAEGQSTGFKFCGNCGQKVSENAVFCNFCGNKLQ